MSLRPCLRLLPFAVLCFAAIAPEAREVASSRPRAGQKPVNEAVNALLTKERDAAILDSWRRAPGDAPRDRDGLEKLLSVHPVRIEDIVTEKWDEAVNPNVETLEKRPELR